MSLLIHKSDVDGKTGQLRFRVQACEKHPETGILTYGPVEHIAIYPRALTNILGGSILAASPDDIRAALNRWMEQHHTRMIEQKRHVERVSAVAQEMRGQTVEFGEEGA